MADLIIKWCEVGLNPGVNESLDAELVKVFPENERRERKTALCFSGEISDDDACLYIGVGYPRSNEDVFSVAISKTEDIDALRRYCEMVLEHHNSRMAKYDRDEVGL